MLRRTKYAAVRIPLYRHEISCLNHYKSFTMSKYAFKTNINCIGCASQIKPHLDKLEKNGQIEHWHVHPTDPDHTLEIETSKLNANEVRDYVKNAGFEAERKRIRK